MRIATSLNVFGNRFPAAPNMGRLAAAGFDGIDFNFADLLALLDWHHERTADAYVDELGRAASDADLTWVQAHGPMFQMFGAEDPHPLRRALCEPALRACGRLGVPWMVLHPDVFPGAYDAAHRKEVLKRNVEFFRGLLPACERYGVGLALENIFDSAAEKRGCPRYFAAVPDELCELIDALKHPLVGACWDTGHARLMQLDQRAALLALGARLKVTHFHENDGLGDDHQFPFSFGKQGVDWNAVIEGLRGAGFEGAWTFELGKPFQSVPEPLFDTMLKYVVAQGRYFTKLLAG